MNDRRHRENRTPLALVPEKRQPEAIRFLRSFGAAEA